MRGWILHKRKQATEKDSAYEIRRFREVAREVGLDVRVVKPEQVDLIVTREGRKSVRLDGEETSLPHFVLPRMGAGTTYFALAVIRHLERLGVHTFNSAASIDIVKDKLHTQQILASNDLPVPKTMLVKFPVDASLVESQLGFPVVVKTLSGSRGKGVYLSESRRSFVDLMQLIDASKPGASIILQQFVEDSHGRDLRVLTIGGRAVACMQRTAPEHAFKANFSAGGSVQRFEIGAEVEWLASTASTVLGLDIAGVDLLFDGDHFKICEVNSSPGFRGLETCCAIDVPREVYRYLAIRLGHVPGTNPPSLAPASRDAVAAGPTAAPAAGTEPRGPEPGAPPMHRPETLPSSSA